MSDDAFNPLPALRRLGDLADVRPVIVTDTREQAPLVFARLASERGTLQTGDYSFLGDEELFAVERKTVADLVGCCVGDNRDRFFRELHRLRGFRFKRLVIVGTCDEIERGEYRSGVTPKAVLATVARFDVPGGVPLLTAGRGPPNRILGLLVRPRNRRAGQRTRPRAWPHLTASASRRGRAHGMTRISRNRNISQPEQMTPKPDPGFLRHSKTASEAGTEPRLAINTGRSISEWRQTWESDNRRMGAAFYIGGSCGGAVS